METEAGTGAETETLSAPGGPGAPGSAPAGPAQIVGGATKVVVATLLAWSGYIHYDLYANHGYRHIHTIGPAFLVQAGGSFAVAFLLVVSVALPGSVLLSVLAAGLSGGALVGFVLSRTTGVAGFEEHGFTPSPDAAISVAVEIGVLVVLAAVAVVAAVSRPSGPARTDRLTGH
ncbi:hypothetical protein FF36_06106 [Frankia torreyi]|uniref:Uncharacterized protein n=2 Tax=Frankiaceae TaxID=74712 RepID=A0A0D8B600_9ACTN|nr:hypothetical protein FF36_06106 [Frankia torreyi]KQM02049.1 hypothetical protein FF86_108415 [Frankia sp. CpI1-P]